MKKFLLFNICLTIIFLSVNLLTLSFIEDKIVDRFTAPFFVYEMGEERYNVVNLGTSHGEVGFDWKSVNHAGLNGLNLGLSSKPFSYDYFLLNFYSENINRDALIILPISLHSLCMNQNSYTPIDAIYNVKVPLTGMVRLNYLWDLYSYPRNYPNDEFESDYLKGTTRPRKCSDLTLKESIRYIELISNEWPNLILVTTPYYYDALADLKEFDEFYDIINQLTYEFGLRYYDYSRDNRFRSKIYFYDASHLNTKGRSLFTEIVINDLLNTQFNE